MKGIQIAEGTQAINELIPKGSSRTLIIHGMRVVIMHTNADSFLAFEPYCPHSSHSLTHAKLNPFGQLVCPSHGYGFDIEQGREMHRRCRNLKLYAVYQKDHVLMIDLC